MIACLRRQNTHHHEVVQIFRMLCGTAMRVRAVCAGWLQGKITNTHHLIAPAPTCEVQSMPSDMFLLSAGRLCLVGGEPRYVLQISMQICKMFTLVPPQGSTHNGST